MKMKPILFNTDMVTSIVAGAKNQTRRIINLDRHDYDKFNQDTDNQRLWHFYWSCKEDSMFTVECPYQIGQVLYVRETWYKATGHDCIYRADKWFTDNLDKTLKWKPSIHMPKKYARLWLEITEIRAEKLRDITDEDCIFEGKEVVSPGSSKSSDYRNGFIQTWNDLYGVKGHGWTDNPWVWVIKCTKCVQSNKNSLSA